MSAGRRGTIAGLLFVLVWVSCAWFGSWEWNPNNLTRLLAAMSIVEQGDATIDEYQALTSDKARFGDHFYLDKAPGMTLLALPAVAAADALTHQRGHDVAGVPWSLPLEHFLRLRTRLAVASTAALLTAIAAVLLFDWGVALGGTGGGIVAALGFALGSPVWGWSTTLLGHAPVAALFVVASWAVWRGSEGPLAPSARLATLAGGALGGAVLVEYPALLGGTVIGLWALWRLRRAPAAARWRSIAAAVAGAAVPLALLVAYNLLAFGTPFRIGYEGVVGFEGMHRGLFGLATPDPEVLGKIIYGLRRGLIWVAPVLAPGAAGLVVLLVRRGQRDVGVLAVAMVATVLLINAAYAYWDGGNSTGPRHAVPAVPFLALGLAPLWGWARGWLARGAILLVLGGSIAINLMIAAAEILTGGAGRFPLWSDVVEHRFLGGALRTVPSEWWGWNPWSGLALYAAFAAAMLVALAVIAATTEARGRTG